MAPTYSRYATERKSLHTKEKPRSRALVCQSVPRAMRLTHRWYLLGYLKLCSRVCLRTVHRVPPCQGYFSVAVLASCSQLCRCYVWAVSMAENHLEYGYLEGESIGELFTEDPVSMGYYCAAVGKKQVWHGLFVCLCAICRRGVINQARRARQTSANAVSYCISPTNVVW